MANIRMSDVWERTFIGGRGGDRAFITTGWNGDICRTESGMGLKKLYDECKIDDAFLYEVKKKIEAIGECPCSIKGECIHGCKPDEVDVMSNWCVQYCPFSKLWHNFMNDIYHALHKYIGV